MFDRLPRTRHSSRLDNRDYTKRRSYVQIDLAVRIASAIGLLGLGLAGWTFQVMTYRERVKLERLDRDARRYLPIVRSLTELDAALDETAAALSYRYTLDQSARMLDCSSKIRAAAVSMAVLESNSTVTISLPSTEDTGMESVNVHVPVRAAAFMVSDLLRIVGQARLLGEVDKRIGVIDVDGRPMGALFQNSVPMMFFELAPVGIPAWRAWLGDNLVRVMRMQRMLDAAARAIQEHVALMIVDVMRQHPELADQFVAIRAEVFKAQRPDFAEFERKFRGGSE